MILHSEYSGWGVKHWPLWFFTMGALQCHYQPIKRKEMSVRWFLNHHSKRWALLPSKIKWRQWNWSIVLTSHGRSVKLSDYNRRGIGFDTRSHRHGRFIRSLKKVEWVVNIGVVHMYTNKRSISICLSHSLFLSLFVICSYRSVVKYRNPPTTVACVHIDDNNDDGCDGPLSGATVGPTNAFPMYVHVQEPSVIYTRLHKKLRSFMHKTMFFSRMFDNFRIWFWPTVITWLIIFSKCHLSYCQNYVGTHAWTLLT